MLDQLTTTARRAAVSVSNELTTRANTLGSVANRSATAVSDTVSDQLTQVADTSQRVASNLGAVAAKTRNVEFDLTALDVSDLAERLTSCGVVSDLTDRINGFDVSGLTERLGRVELPRFDVADLPTVELPNLDTPRFDRVFDIARDVTYAGIGAAVIATQQVDAGVRRITSRAA